MTEEERYYRRSYSLLNELNNTYQYGYNKQEILRFWKKCLLDSSNNYHLFNQKRDGLLLTIIIALLGVNKESIEKAEIIQDYQNSCVDVDFRNMTLNSSSIEKITQFENSRSRQTLFDNWLSIKNCPDTDISNNDIIRRVRNGLLHSNFYPDTESEQLSFTCIKTKSYYESVILNQNFFQFIISYFSNVPTVGLSEKTIINYNEKIKNKANFRKYLKSITMVQITHNMDNYNGYNSLDNKISKILNGKHIKRNILAELNNADKNGINIQNIEHFALEDSTVENILNYFQNKYGDSFYLLPEKDKISLIECHIQYIFENKRHIGNWLLHFYHLINHCIDPQFNVDDEFFENDEYAVESLQPTLAILKGYLILYRMQNNTFAPITYENIDFDFNDEEFYCWPEKNGNITPEDYYLDSFNKKRNKDTISSDDDIKKSIICEVIRNGFAHGNIRSFISDITNESIIEIKDIDKKTNKARCIQMTIEKFNKFLLSEAFLPKYCFTNSNHKQQSSRK